MAAGSSFFRVLFSLTAGHCHFVLWPSPAAAKDPDIPTQTGILTLTANEAFCYVYWSPGTPSGPAELCWPSQNYFYLYFIVLYFVLISSFLCLFAFVVSFSSLMSIISALKLPILSLRSGCLEAGGWCSCWVSKYVCFYSPVDDEAAFRTIWNKT